MCRILTSFICVLAAGLCAGPVTLDGRTFTGSKTVELTESNDNSVITNCTFRNLKQSRPAIAIKGTRGVRIENCTFDNLEGDQKDTDFHAINCGYSGHDIVIRNCTFINVAADGFQCGNNGDDISNIRIEGCTFIINVSRRGENAVDIKRCRGPVVIRNNYIEGYRSCHKTDQYGCTGDNGPGIVLHNYSQDITIEGNVFYDNNLGIKIVDGKGPVDGVLIRNNVFFDNVNEGVAAYNTGKNIHVVNNTFVDNGTDNLYLAGSLRNVANKNNLFVGTGGATNEYGGDGNLRIAGRADAAFKDPGAKDFHLTAQSPAIDQGVRVAAVGTDMDGETRPNGGAYDVGADEYYGSTHVDPPDDPPVTGTTEWYENNGLVSIEAEHGTGGFEVFATGGVSGGYIKAPATDASMSYTIRLTRTGNFHLYALVKKGCDNAGSCNDVFVTMDGEKLYAAADDSTRPDGIRSYGDWGWWSLAKGPGSHTPEEISNDPVYFRITAAGEHTLTLTKRSANYLIDKLVLSQTTLDLSGAGPAQTDTPEAVHTGHGRTPSPIQPLSPHAAQGPGLTVDIHGRRILSGLNGVTAVGVYVRENVGVGFRCGLRHGGWCR
ncbi:MAG: hypothetical protein GF331_04140 [Chitinivibrionales bacterium]|nr:hypothetical protein [Chitinivibrionales bacterium]